jgi:hypothetical protein
MVRRTADPSASLGMTKGRVALPFGAMVVNAFCSAAALHGSVALPFVIPSEAERSAVLLISSENPLASSPDPLVH